MQTLWQDLRYGLRVLRKSPGFATVAILTLALGIGANTAIFSALNGILLYPLPYADSSRLVTIYREQTVNGIRPDEVREIQQQCRAFERMATYAVGDGLILGGALPERRPVNYVSADFFPMLGVRPLLGRPILPEDVQPGNDRVTVLSYLRWRDSFGSDARIIGRSILVNDKPFTVIGVMPREFELGASWTRGDEDGIWVPLSGAPFGDRSDTIVARAKKTAAESEARAEVQTVSAHLATWFSPGADHVQLSMERIKPGIAPSMRTALLILSGAVGFVLLLACVNLSALLIARSWARQKEIAIRQMLGATRFRIICQLLTESLLLALVGGALGLLFSVWGIGVLRAIAPPDTPRLYRVTLDTRVLWFTFGISLFAAILFGLAPALQRSSHRVGGALKDGLSGSFVGLTTRQRNVLWRALLIAEVALAVILVIGGALMLRSFEKLVHIDTGVRTDHVLTMHLDFSVTTCLSEEQNQANSSEAKTASEKAGTRSDQKSGTPKNRNTSPSRISQQNLESCPSASSEVLDQVRSLTAVQSAAISYGGLIQGALVTTGLTIEGRQGGRSFGRRMVDGGCCLPGLFLHCWSSAVSGPRFCGQ